MNSFRLLGVGEVTNCTELQETIKSRNLSDM